MEAACLVRRLGLPQGEEALKARLRRPGHPRQPRPTQGAVGDLGLHGRIEERSHQPVVGRLGTGIE